MSASSEKKHYIAFISYSTADEKWAKWLWHKLEYYPIPSNLRREHPHLPKHLRPVFWYKQDLSGTHLQKSLQKELDDSQYLIVICSPSSAQSEWVNKEVERFIELGRTKYIIPLIIAGTPHAANSADECFPIALRNLPQEQEIRGIDVRRQEGKQHAFIDVVATILGIRFNDLWQRHQRRRKKNIIRFTLISLVVLLFIVAQIAYKRPHIEYYADYVDKWGLPMGVVPVDKKDKEHSHRTYQFLYRRTPMSEPNALQLRLEQVAYINSVDLPVEHNNIEYATRTAIMQMQYSKQTGELTQIQYASANGEILYRQDISMYNSVPGAIADFKSAAENMGSGFAHANTARMEQQDILLNSAIKRFAYERDHNGYFTQITYHSNNDDDLESSKACDMNGIYGITFERDSLGRVITVEYIDAEGNITCTKKGVAGYRFTYDNHGSVNSYLYFDMEHKPILNEKQWAYYVEQTNEYGNTMKGMYHNEEGVLCTASEGYAQFTYKYDERGNKIQQSYFDTNDMPCLNTEGIAGWKAKYNDFGWCIEKSYFGLDGKPCIHPAYGYSKTTYKHNILGKCIEETYYGVDDKLCHCTDGYAQVRNKHNFLNQCIETSYFDSLGNPCTYMNASVIKRKYDEKGNCIEEAYFDALGNPCSFGLSDNNATKWCGKFNAQGYITDHLYYDINNQLIKSLKLQYDIRGNLTDWAYYDGQGKLAYYEKEHAARFTCAYDKQGNCIEYRFYNENNELFLYRNQYAIHKIKYDKRSNPIEEAYYDTNNRLITTRGKYAIQRMKYDERGNCIEKANYDKTKRLCLDSKGVAIYQYDYDKRGNMLEERFLDINNAPVLNNKGYAKATYQYDIRNNRTHTTYYNQRGKKVKQ